MRNHRLNALRILPVVALVTMSMMGRCADARPAGRGERAAGMERTTGLVRAIDLERRTLVLVTGVGYALRLERLEVPEGVPVQDRGARAPLSTLTPGCIVRVGCHHPAAERVAATLELIERPAPAPKP